MKETFSQRNLKTCNGGKCFKKYVVARNVRGKNKYQVKKCFDKIVKICKGWNVIEKRVKEYYGKK